MIGTLIAVATVVAFLAVVWTEHRAQSREDRADRESMRERAEFVRAMRR